MEQDLALMPTESLGRLLAQSGYFKDVRDMSQAIVKVLAGREIGIGPIASMTGIFVLRDGRISYGANVIAACIKRSTKYTYVVVEHTDQVCVLEFRERTPTTVLGTSRFTIEDARAAGLLAGASALNWTHYPRNMLFARALTNGAKWFCPDVFGGVAVYTPEELGAVVDADGVPLEETAQPSPPEPAATDLPSSEAIVRYDQLLGRARAAGIDTTNYEYDQTPSRADLYTAGTELLARVQAAEAEQLELDPR